MLMSSKTYQVIQESVIIQGQSLSVAKELGLDMEKTNVNGGAIALGIHSVISDGSQWLWCMQVIL